MSVVHVLSIDVEEWLSATILQLTGRVEPPTRQVAGNTNHLLRLLDECGVKATWFVLGEIADAFPEVIREVGAAGHQLGVHGYHHHAMRSLSNEEFLDAAARAKESVERAAGVEAAAYRATDFGLNVDTWERLAELPSLGFQWDSSLCPAEMPRYGIAGAPPAPFWLEGRSGRMLEVPIGVAKLLGQMIPLGGGYFRLLPLWATHRLFRQLERRGGPGVFYLHPCETEVESKLPELPLQLTEAERRSVRSAYRKAVVGRSRGARKLSEILKSYRFSSLSDVFPLSSVEADRTWCPGEIARDI